MPRVCTVCSHPAREAIDTALVASVPKRRIATQHAIDEAAVRRHARGHLPAQLQKAAGMAELNRLDAIVDHLRRMWQRAETLGEDAEADGDRRSALQAVREARECLALFAKLTGDLDERPNVNVLLAGPEWRAVRTVIIEALDEFPEARASVSRGLLSLETASRP
jgi:hypothetical protein